MRTVHSIEVACPPQTAFALCLDVTRWPEIFPPCLHASVLSETDTEQAIEICAKANGEVMSWRSVRQVNRDELTISFAQTKPSPLVEYMRGKWSFRPAANEGCVIALGHDFEVRRKFEATVPGVESPEDALDFMCRTVDENSKRELNGYRDAIERMSWRHEFSETLTIPQPKAAIYKLLRDAASWPWLLPHCNGVEVTYEDAVFQEFVMNVTVGSEKESIRSVRSMFPDRIEYFQPEPPPALREHHGRWTLRECLGGVEVTSWHRVVLSPQFWKDTSPDEAKQRVEFNINRNSLGTMKAIVKKLGGEHVHA